MCGIVAAAAERNVTPILIDGLERLDEDGDGFSNADEIDNGADPCSAASVPPDNDGDVGKVARLVESLAPVPEAHVGLAHTRWATHGRPSETNAHPQVSGGHLALVHNGIIENHETLHQRLESEGYRFASETDTEAIVHLIDSHIAAGADLTTAVCRARNELEGAFALAVVDSRFPDRVVAARQGSPLVVGVGVGEHFLASDAAALVPVTQQVVSLADGDVVCLTAGEYTLLDAEDRPVDRPIRISSISPDATEKGGFRHFMQKEIHEQPRAVADTLDGLVDGTRLLPGLDRDLLAAVRAVRIIACGTSYHAGLVARYWIEAFAGVPVAVEIASEYRYREPAIVDGTLFVAISQSGETADTLAAVARAGQHRYIATLGICNVPESALTRECDHVLMTRAGMEVGVASTKAFTTQLTLLMVLTAALAEARGADSALVREILEHLGQAPEQMREVLAMDETVAELAEHFADKHNALFLGRGPGYPIAMEGALKLKEISYIHAEAYAAGELKHGPLALVDEDLPVVVTASSNRLLEKLKSNLQEVRARGGQLYVFADRGVTLGDSEGMRVIRVPVAHSETSPILQIVPLQLLAYHVGVLKGTDVDQPRNLAKSVTVE